MMRSESTPSVGERGQELCVSGGRVLEEGLWQGGSRCAKRPLAVA